MKTFLKDCFKEVKRQLFGTGGKKRLILTRLAQLRMMEHGLTETNIQDVFYNGVEVKKEMVIRTYNGYAIGLIYTYDKQIHAPIIITCWKHWNKG